MTFRGSSVLSVGAFILALVILIFLLGFAGTAAQAATSVFINELHYDNSGSDSGEAVEIAGPAATDLTDWSVWLYNGSSSQLKVYDNFNLSGSIPDQDNGYGALDFARAGIQNGSPDGLALVDPGDNLIQFLCYEGTFTAIDGPAEGETCVDIGVSEGSSTPAGYSLQLTGTGTMYEDFTWDGPFANTFGTVNTATGQSFGGIVNAPVVVECGSWLNTFEGNTATREVSATDADGKVIDMSITIDPTPASGTITFQNFVSATLPSDTATGDVVVDGDVPAGIYDVTVTAVNDDATPQEGQCSFNVDVDPFLTIGEVQGVVEDDDFGTSHDSPYEGEYVAVQGVIFEKTQEYRSSGGAYYGFFIQNTAAGADGDPNSSDGIFVFHFQYPTLLVDGGGFYFPEVGDEVVLRGQVEERFQNTRLRNPLLTSVVRSDVDLDAEIPAFEADPPDAYVSDNDFDDIQDAYRYWERREGMRGQIPAGSIVLNGRDVFASSFDSEVWVARADTVIGQRADPFEQRSFRDVHPLDDITTLGFDNDNPYRILMGSFGVKAAADDTTTLLTPASTYDIIDNAPIGGVYYNFGKYSIQVEEQPFLVDGVDPDNNGPSPRDTSVEYSVVTFNVENLYDYVDDVFDGCDFNGSTADSDNDGCPLSEPDPDDRDVTPPYDYVPPSDASYQFRLQEIAQQIVHDLHAPEIVMAQELEDQDVCTLVAGVYNCPDPVDQVNNADGKPDVLQELAKVIYDMSGIMYDAALDRDGADDRGIISGYLFRTDRVELLPVDSDDPVLGSNPTINYHPEGSEWFDYNYEVQNPKVLNATLPDDVTGSTDGPNVFTRPAQVAKFRIWRASVGMSVFQEVYLSNNHFSSGPDRRVDQRTEQAAFNAAIVEALQDANAGVYVSVGGDLNVYPRPDDPFPPPNESDQLASLYNLPMTNLWNIQASENPVSAYSYIYQGQTQTLDQLFVVPAWLNDLVETKAAHINADFPADFPSLTEGPRGTSDHDPVAATYQLEPTLNRVIWLIDYLDSLGEITGVRTAKILTDRLERAQTFNERGQMQAYDSMLKTFVLQVEGMTPSHISDYANTILINEVSMIIN